MDESTIENLASCSYRIAEQLSELFAKGGDGQARMPPALSA